MAKYCVLKYYYNEETQEVNTRVVQPKKLMFDNRRDIEDDLNWIGEKIVIPARDLIDMFPKKEKEISQKVNGN